MTCDLRRLRRNGFISRTSASYSYVLTPEGRRLAMFFTKLHARVVTPSLAVLDPELPAAVVEKSPLGRAWRSFIAPCSNSPTHPESQPES